MRGCLGGCCALFVVWMVPAVASVAACSATPQAAARAALGGEDTVRQEGTTGYRAEDVQTDPVLHRAWVRVRRCDLPTAPAVLVPFAASVPSDGLRTTAASPAAPPPPPPPLLIHAGEAVRAVFASSAVRMEMAAIADQSGAVGERIALRLQQQSLAGSDERPQRIHGTVLARGTVEVTP